MNRHPGSPAPPAPPPDPVGDFLRRLTRDCSEMHWRLDGGHKLRTTLCGVSCCPLMAVGWVRSAHDRTNRVLPDTRHLGSAAGVSDRTAAAIVHLADDMRTSRHYTTARRRQLLAACGLVEGYDVVDGLEVVEDE